MGNIFKRSFKNILDGAITSVLGTLVMVMTIVMLWTGKISFMWEGVVGLGAGCFLLIAPDDISGLIKTWVMSRFKKNNE